MFLDVIADSGCWRTGENLWEFCWIRSAELGSLTPGSPVLNNPTPAGVNKLMLLKIRSLVPYN